MGQFLRQLQQNQELLAGQVRRATERLNRYDLRGLQRLQTTPLGLLLPTTKRKSATQVVNNSATLVDAAGLSMHVDINEVWYVEARLIVAADAAADVKVGWTGPASATLDWEELDSFPVDALAIGGTLTVPGNGASQRRLTILAGFYTGSVSSGTLQLQFAQASAQSNDASIFANSCLVAHRLPRGV
jgi:hypothetical protein